MPGLKHTKIIDVNVIVANDKAVASDSDLFFADNNGNVEPIFWVPPETTMIDLLVQCGIFESKGQAKKSGWKSKPHIPDGFSETTVGKLKHKLTILKVV